MRCCRGLSSFYLKLLGGALFSVVVGLGCSSGGGGGGQDHNPAPKSYIGQVVLGPIVDAQVRLYKYSSPETVIWEGTTSHSDNLDNAGLIDLPPDFVAKINAGRCPRIVDKCYRFEL